MISVRLDAYGRATHIIDDDTGNTVDLTGLSPNERAYCLIVAGHDPQTYEGLLGPECLIGQVHRLTGSLEERPWTVAQLARDGKDDYVLNDPAASELFNRLERIYALATSDPYSHDAHAALDMAREELGVNLDKLPDAMEDFPAPGSSRE